ncbi:polymerase (RNA) mitochondrial (DNA directed) POLRMT [Toxoplasma gondii TgCatPRC2]|uniref:DNA-directed RNA polymerase n=1 Tax=Toxoplasma gondii TgCatPRC2 TaxID=1130821 RepID=A0A151HGB6_TOXGO|nr:polymerase (RNA) mitochondrial (DNA directed) POLRMT [Toxoplasma gondii TgCatPRC2]
MSRRASILLSFSVFSLLKKDARGFRSSLSVTFLFFRSSLSFRASQSSPCVRLFLVFCMHGCERATMQFFFSLRPARRQPFRFAGPERRVPGAPQRETSPASSSNRGGSAVYVSSTAGASAAEEKAARRRQRVQSVCVLNARTAGLASAFASGESRRLPGWRHSGSTQTAGTTPGDRGRQRETEVLATRRRRDHTVRSRRAERRREGEASPSAELTQKENCGSLATLKWTSFQGERPHVSSVGSFLHVSARCVSHLALPESPRSCVLRRTSVASLPSAAASSLLPRSSLSVFSFLLSRSSSPLAVSSGCATARNTAGLSKAFRAAVVSRDPGRCFSSSSAAAEAAHSGALPDVSGSSFLRGSSAFPCSTSASPPLSNPLPSSHAYAVPSFLDSFSSSSSSSSSHSPSQHEAEASRASAAPASWPFQDALDALAAQGVHTPDEQAQALGFASAPHLGLETLRRLSPLQEKLVFHWLLTGEPSPPRSEAKDPAASSSSAASFPAASPSSGESAAPSALSPLSPPSTEASCASPPTSAGASPPSLPACVLSCLHILEEEMLLKGLVISDLPRHIFFSHLREAALPQEIAVEESERKQREAQQLRTHHEKTSRDWRSSGDLFAQARDPGAGNSGVHTPQIQSRASGSQERTRQGGDMACGTKRGGRTEGGQLPSEQDAASPRRQELLNSEWITARKKEIYGDNPYPFPLRWKHRSGHGPSSLSSPPHGHSRSPSSISSSSPSSSLLSSPSSSLLSSPSSSLLSSSSSSLLSSSSGGDSVVSSEASLQEHPSSCSSEEPLCILEKRQIIVERCVWARMLEEMEQQKSFLAGAGADRSGDASEALFVDRGLAKRVWYFWVGEMRTRIAALQQEQQQMLSRFSRKLAPDENSASLSSSSASSSGFAADVGKSERGECVTSKKRRADKGAEAGDARSSSTSTWSAPKADEGLQKDLEAEKTLLPLDVDATVLALITARTAVQLILVPTASSAVLPGKKGRGDEPRLLGGDALVEALEEDVERPEELRGPRDRAATSASLPTCSAATEEDSGGNLQTLETAEPLETLEAAAKETAERRAEDSETEENGEDVEATAAALIQNRTQRQVPVTQMALAIGNAVNLEVNALRSESFFRGAAGGSLFSASSSSRLVLPQPRLFREHELLKKRAEGKTLDPRESRELQRLLATPHSHHEIWDIKKKLQVGGLLLGVLLRHAFVEADYAAAKRELAEELQQKEREKELIRRAKEKRQHGEAERENVKRPARPAECTDTLEAVRATECTDTPGVSEEGVEVATQPGEVQGTQPSEQRNKPKRKRGRPKPLFGTAFDSEDFAHLTVYRSRRSFTKVEVPAFFHRVIYNPKTQRFLGVIQMRRVCYSQLVSGQKHTSFFSPGKQQPSGHSTSTSSPSSSSPLSSAPASSSSPFSFAPPSSSPSPSASGAPLAPSSFRTLPSPPSQVASPSFWIFLKYLPMVLPPLPWQDYSRGAYLMLRNSFVRAVSYGEVKSAGRVSRKEEEELEESEEREECEAPDESGDSASAADSSSGAEPREKKRKEACAKREKIAFLGGAGRVKMARDFHAYDTALPRAVVSALGSQAWRINKAVLGVMEAVWERGLEVGRLPPRDSAGLEEEIFQLRRVVSNPRSSGTSAASIRLRHLLQQAGKLQSERPSFLLKLQVARCFQHLDAVYFPHNIDFRGRCYPLPPHLNHMGDDICRSLLVFAEAKPLGPQGLGWLKVHIANLFGVNKVSFAERQAWVDARREQLLQVAEDPLNPRSLHLLEQEADDPWQALSALLELKKVVAHGEKNSAQFLSALPIHQDGSCNGLQHYAALGRDRRGGEAVNLIGGEKPRDVYSFVLEVVKQRVHADAARGSEGSGCSGAAPPPPESRLAALLIEHNLLQRKVVKQTVMTICYGVTAIGARDQVTRQLEDLIGETVDEATLKSLGGYLSRVVLSSIGEVFQSAMRLKKWLDEVSKTLNRLGLPVAWMLPLIHFGAEQPYRSGKAMEVRTVFQTHIVRVAGDDTPTSASKQRLGFPPNFIHSLDATHMMLTARRCLLRDPPPLVPPAFSQSVGGVETAWATPWKPMAFAAVHDSYWTHAGDVDRMRTILRQEFVRLYSQPILEEFYEGLRARLGRFAEDLPPPPTKGSLDITEVLHSDYFFH